MSDIEFGELPPGSTPGPRTDWASVADKLRGNPGQWARIATKPTTGAAANLANAVKTGVVVAFRPPESFEAARRGNDVWARYVGEQS